MAINLDGARKAMDALMTDECRITRPGGIDADVLDPVTGLLAPATTPGTVYRGRCLVSAKASSDRTRAGARQRVTNYTAKIPWDAKEVRPGDKLEVTKATDKQLQGKLFEVAGSTAKTIIVSRNLDLEEVASADERDNE